MIKRREHSIKRRLALSYISYVLLFVLFIAIVTNVFVQNQFSHYAKQKQINQITQITEQVTSHISSADYLEMIGTNALDNGYIITVKDTQGNEIWDANVHNGHQCEMVLDSIISRMKANYPDWDGLYVTKDFTLMDSSGTHLGTLTIGYLSPYFYTEEDLSLLSTLNTLYFISTIGFIILALVLTQFMARRLSRPLENVVLTSYNIAKGNYGQVPNDSSNIKEINELTTSINTLSATLKQEDDLRKQLTADVTHELRTPLTTLQGHIEGMIDGIIENNPEGLQTIYDEIIRLTKIVSDLDKLMKLDFHTEELQKEYLNISTLLENVCVIFQAPFKAKNIDFNYNPHDVMVYIDKDKMNQVFVNLLSNALKYTPEHEHVRLWIEETTMDVNIYVKDTGIGISEAELPHIFERFYRADKSRTRDTGGSGIGLSIVKSIVLAHNGSLEATSDLGKGTTITVTLPKLCK